MGHALLARVLDTDSSVKVQRLLDWR